MEATSAGEEIIQWRWSSVVFVQAPFDSLCVFFLVFVKNKSVCGLTAK